MAEVVMDGFVVLVKALASHDVWTQEPFSRGQAWVDLLLLANDRPRDLRLRNVPVAVDTGQCAWSVMKLAERWKWGRPKVNAFLDELQRKDMLKVEHTNVTTMITITNYQAYRRLVLTAEDTAENALNRTADRTASDTPNRTADRTASEQQTELQTVHGRGKKEGGIREELGKRKVEEGGGTPPEMALPSFEEALAYVQQSRLDYTLPQVRSTWLSFEATKINNRWSWGKGSVTNWRAALESRLHDDWRLSPENKNAAPAENDELDDLRAELQWQTDLNRRLKLQKRLEELEG